MVQEILTQNRYPNFTSPMVTFQTYPLGSATYIYYCCLLAGTEESTMMLIQAFMMVCAIMPMFSLIGKHKLSAFLYMIVFTNFAFVYVDNVYLASLLVDSLLSLFSMGSFLIIWSISFQTADSVDENKKTDIWVAAPLLAMTVMIKNSGIFFAIPSMLVLVSAWKQDSRRKLLYAAGILMPLVYILLWRQHCEYAFWNAAYSKHAVSFARYAERFQSLPTDFIEDTGRRILDFLLGHPAFFCIPAMLLALVGYNSLFHKDRVKGSLCFSGALYFMYLLYMAGVYGMYVFSMPAAETEELLELKRYVDTMDLAAFYLITAYMLRYMGETNFNRKMIAAFAALLVLWGCTANWRVISGRRQTYARQWFEAQIQQYNIPLGTPCFLCNSVDIADGYLRNIISSLLWSPDIYMKDMFTGDSMDNLHKIPYLIMFDYDDEEMNQWIQENYPEQYGNTVIIPSSK